MASLTAQVHSARPQISVKYLVFSLLLSLGTIAVLLYLTWSPGIFERMAWKRTPGLFIALGVVILRLWFLSAKIRYLSEKRFSWLASLRIILSWEFASSISPTTIGGAPAATYAMTKENLKLGESTAITIYSIMLDQIWIAMLIPVLLIAGIYLEIVPPETGLAGQTAMIAVYSALLLYASTLTYGIFRNPAIFGKIAATLFSLPYLRKYKKGVESEAGNLEAYARQMNCKSFRFVLTTFSFSTMAWLCRAALPTIVVLSLVPADVLLSSLRSMAMMLAGLFIPTPGGSGGLEGLFALFQGPLMTRDGFIGLGVFLWRFISYYLIIGAGMMVMTWYLRGENANTITAEGK